jgi:hypothetical protein
MARTLTLAHTLACPLTIVAVADVDSSRQCTRCFSDATSIIVFNIIIIIIIIIVISIFNLGIVGSSLSIIIIIVIVIVRVPRRHHRAVV